MRAQDLRKKPFDWLKDALSGVDDVLSGVDLDKETVPAKKAHSLFNKTQKYLP
jgi:hypothetical protein